MVEHTNRNRFPDDRRADDPLAESDDATITPSC